MTAYRARAASRGKSLSSLREEIAALRSKADRCDNPEAYLLAVDDVLTLVDIREGQMREYMLAYGAVLERPDEERPAREAVERFGFPRGDDERRSERFTLAIVEAIDALAATIREKQ